MCCPLVLEFSVGIGGFVIGLGQMFFFSLRFPYRFLLRTTSILTKSGRAPRALYKFAGQSLSLTKVGQSSQSRSHV